MDRKTKCRYVGNGYEVNLYVVLLLHKKKKQKKEENGSEKAM